MTFLVSRLKNPLGNVQGGLSVDFGLLLTKGVALVAAALGGINAALTAPAQALAGHKAVHLVARVMDPATVAEQRFRHGDLVRMGGCNQHSVQCLLEDYAFALSQR